MPPHQRYCPLHKARRFSYLWAHGFSPFAPFGNATHLSDAAVDQVSLHPLVFLTAASHRVSPAELLAPFNTRRTSTSRHTSNL
jgi:hypothetical protein